MLRDIFRFGTATSLLLFGAGVPAIGVLGQLAERRPPGVDLLVVLVVRVVCEPGATLDAQSLTVKIERDNNTLPTTVEVAVSYPFSTVTRFPGVPSEFTVKRSVRVRVAPDLPVGKRL